MSEQLKCAKEIVTAARQGEVEWTELEGSIATELNAARSDLARKVLAEIGPRDRPGAKAIIPGFTFSGRKPFPH